MKITKRQLKRIIKEEKAKVLAEQPLEQYEDDAFLDLEEALKNEITDALEKGLIWDDVEDAFQSAKDYLKTMWET